jgi:hypothetical protein
MLSQKRQNGKHASQNSDMLLPFAFGPDIDQVVHLSPCVNSQWKAVDEAVGDLAQLDKIAQIALATHKPPHFRHK